MAKLNIAKVNTLIRKGYLLAGVIMAANMFTVNEVKAMNSSSSSLNNSNIFQKNGEREGNHVRPGDKSEQNIMDKVLSKILSWEGRINFFGGLFFSAANNYLKLWDYNPGWYRQFGCRGCRSKRFLNGVLQFEVNFINLGRGAFWLFLGAYNFTKSFTADKKKDKYHKDYLRSLHFSFLVASCVAKFLKQGKSFLPIIAFIVFFLLQGFVSIPLAIHISNLSISISLDSLIWGVTGMILELKAKKRREKEREFSFDGFKKVGGNNENGEGENYD